MNELLYTIIISFLIASSILVIGINEMNKIIYEKDEKQIEGEIGEINQKIDFLGDVSVGSFDHVKFTVPNGFKVEIKKNVVIVYGKKNKTFELNGEVTCLTSDSYDCVNKVILKPGVYNLLIYHGDRFESTYTICFK